ncbi:hypothetical protein L9F63_018501 [Diploptera punctata]|uniref:Uncharacterized protein n=1 Tax=Diploptera punctata TaxID=6984 RepID=A0AAD7ZYH0_DIPPU|nr:hypothetical protein L9F63_018501 [Diploptera punctata]
MSENNSEREEDEEQVSQDIEQTDLPDQQKISKYDSVDTSLEPYNGDEKVTELKDQHSSRKTQEKEANNNENYASKKDDEFPQISHQNIWVHITPQMIVASLKQLHYRKELLTLEDIMGYITQHYPVKVDKDELKKELAEKLRCACHLGFVMEEDRKFRLPFGQEKLHEKKPDFRAFWEMYLRNPRSDKESQSKNGEQSSSKISAINGKTDEKKK